MGRSLFIIDLAVLQLVCGDSGPRVLIVASHTYFLDSTIIPDPSLLAGFTVEEN